MAPGPRFARTNQREQHGTQTKRLLQIVIGNGKHQARYGVNAVRCKSPVQEHRRKGKARRFRAFSLDPNPSRRGMQVVQRFGSGPKQDADRNRRTQSDAEPLPAREHGYGVFAPNFYFCQR